MAPVIVLEDEDTSVRISEIDVVHLPKNACMSDSGAGMGVDPSLFELRTDSAEQCYTTSR